MIVMPHAEKVFANGRHIGYVSTNSYNEGEYLYYDTKMREIGARKGKWLARMALRRYVAIAADRPKMQSLPRVHRLALSTAYSIGYTTWSAAFGATVLLPVFTVLVFMAKAEANDPNPLHPLSMIMWSWVAAFAFFLIVFALNRSFWDEIRVGLIRRGLVD